MYLVLLYLYLSDRFTLKKFIKYFCSTDRYLRIKPECTEYNKTYLLLQRWDICVKLIRCKYAICVYMYKSKYDVKLAKRIYMLQKTKKTIRCNIILELLQCSHGHQSYDNCQNYQTSIIIICFIIYATKHIHIFSQLCISLLLCRHLEHFQSEQCFIPAMLR